MPKLRDYLPPQSKSKASKVFQSIVAARSFAVGPPERVAIDQAYRETQQLLAIAATCALAPMIFIMWFVKDVDLKDGPDEGGKDDGSQTEIQNVEISTQHKN